MKVFAVRICVFCGSNPGDDSLYAETARSVGHGLADKGYDLVYGGGRAGLMGVVADTALAAGGKVIGVIPRALVDREVAHVGLTQLLVVDTMHERKAKMAELSDGFIALPGGVGTLEEIFEQWGWARLGIHQKPCAFLDVNGFFQPIRSMTEHMLRSGFMRRDHAELVTFASDLDQIMRAFQAHKPPNAGWFRPQVVGKAKEAP